MKLSDDVSFRKARRKVRSDGLLASALTGTELVARKKILYPFFRRLVDSGHPELLSAREAADDGATVEVVEDDDAQQSPSRVYAVATGPGYILSETGTGVTDYGAFIGETVSAPGSRHHKLAVALSRHTFFDGPWLARDLIQERVKTVDRRAVPLGTACSLIPRYQNYYHWTVETLPKLRSIREHERATGETVTLLLPEGAPDWMEEPLSYCGVDPSEVAYADADMYKTSNLVVPSFPKPTTQDCGWVRDRVLDSVDDQGMNINPGSNVYISRKDTQERRVLNEDTVVEVLENHGFESYRLADYSVAEQAVLFNEADLVVGAHGAGFANLIYAENTAVLELFGEKVKPNYANLAETIGLPYEYMKCQPRGVDLQVDTERLATTVEELLSKHNEEQE